MPAASEAAASSSPSARLRRAMSKLPVGFLGYGSNCTLGKSISQEKRINGELAMLLRGSLGSLGPIPSAKSKGRGSLGWGSSLNPVTGSVIVRTAHKLCSMRWTRNPNSRPASVGMVGNNEGLWERVSQSSSGIRQIEPLLGVGRCANVMCVTFALCCLQDVSTVTGTGAE